MFIEKSKLYTTKLDLLNFQDTAGNLLVTLSDTYKLEKFLDETSIPSSRLKYYTAVKKLKIGAELYTEDIPKKRLALENLGLQYKDIRSIDTKNTLLDLSSASVTLEKFGNIRKNLIISQFSRDIKSLALSKGIASTTYLFFASYNTEYKNSLYRQLITLISEKEISSITLLLAFRTGGKLKFIKVSEPNKEINIAKAASLYKRVHATSFPIGHNSEEATASALETMELSDVERKLLTKSLNDKTISKDDLKGDKGKVLAMAVINAMGDSNTMTELKSYDEKLYEKTLKHKLENIGKKPNSIIIPTKLSDGKTATVQDLNTTYDGKLYESDLKNMASAFENHPDYPLVLTKFKKVNTSNDLTDKEQITMVFKDPTGKNVTIHQNVPKLRKDGRSFKIDGTRYTISAQLVSKPILKVAEDKVAITTNYNKTFISRFGENNTTESKSFIKALSSIPIEGLKLIPNSDSDEPLQFRNIDVTKISDNYYGLVNKDIDFEVSFVKNKTLNNNKYDTEKYELIGKIKDNFILLDSTMSISLLSNTGSIEKLDVLFLDYVKDVLNIKRNVTPNSFGMFSRARLHGKNIPLIHILMTRFSIKEIFQSYGIKYRVSDSMSRDTENRTEIPYRLADYNLFINAKSFEQKLLVSGLLKMSGAVSILSNTTLREFFEKNNNVFIGKILGASAKNIALSLDKFIDPITKEILDDLVLPTNILEVLLYANTLLRDNEYTKSNDMNGYRIRPKQENISAMIYRNLAKDIDIFAKTYKFNKRAKFSQPIDKTMRGLMTELPSFTTLSSASPTVELDEGYSKVLYKGFLGINSDRSVSHEARSPHKSQMGIVDIGALTDSATVGATKYLSFNAAIKNGRGFIDTNLSDEELKEDPSKLLDFNGLMLPFVSATADSPRSAMARIQARHQLGLNKLSTKPFIRSGYENAAADLLSDDFVIKPTCSGKISKIDKDKQLITINCKDGKSEVLSYKKRNLNNGGAGLTTVNSYSLSSKLKVGSSITPKTKLAYNDAWFKDETLTVQGIRLFVMFVPMAECVEDGALVSKSVADRLKLEYVKDKRFTINKEQELTMFKKIGENVQANSDLATYRVVGDEDTKSFVSGLNLDEFEIDENIDMSSKISGTINNIKVYYNKTDEDLGEQEKSLIKYLKSIDSSEKVNADNKRVFNLQGEQTILGKRMNDVFIIEYFVEKVLTGKSGNKLTIHSTKSVYQVLDDELMPRTVDGKVADVVVSPFSLATRMVPNNILVLYISRIIVELQKRMLTKKPEAGKKIWKDFLKFMYTNNPKGFKDEIQKIKDMSDKDFTYFITEDIHYTQTAFKEPKMNDIVKAAEFFNIQLNERVVMPSNGNALTESEAPVGYHDVRFLVQINEKKAAFNHKVESVNANTGLITATEKTAAVSLNEAVGMYTYNIASEVLGEFFSMRADNLDAKDQMLNEIIKNGSVSQDDISSSGQGQTAKTISSMFVAAGYKNDFMSDYTVKVDDAKQDTRF